MLLLWGFYFVGFFPFLSVCVCVCLVQPFLTILYLKNRNVYFEPFYFGNNLCFVLSVSLQLIVFMSLTRNSGLKLLSSA